MQKISTMVRCKYSIYNSFYDYDYHYHQIWLFQKNKGTGENWGLNDNKTYPSISTPQC